MAGVQVRPVEQRDHDRWRELYKGYTDFYHEMAERVWGWVQGPGPELECLVAVDDNDRAVALAHFRPFVRPLRPRSPASSMTSSSTRTTVGVAPQTRCWPGCGRSPASGVGRP